MKSDLGIISDTILSEKPKIKKARTILVHAIWHLKFGPETEDRIPDNGDVAAIAILTQNYLSFNK
jgi:hypothetical protein